MLHDEVWDSLGIDRKAVLCQPCMEKRLGRDVVRDDLIICLFNHWQGWRWTYDEICADQSAAAHYLSVQDDL